MKVASIASVVAFAAPIAIGGDFLTIDQQNRSLIEIDSSTGAVVTIGPMNLPDLAQNCPELFWLGPRLLGLTAGTGVDGSSILFELDPATGDGTVLATLVEENGDPISRSEAVVVQPDRTIIVAFGAPQSLAISSRLGELALDGGVTELIDLEPFRPGADSDAMVLEPDGSIVSIDNFILVGATTTNVMNVERFSLAPPAVSLLFHVDQGPGGSNFGPINAMARSPGGLVVALRRDGLIILDTDQGFVPLSFLPISGSSGNFDRYCGLVTRQPPACNPADLAPPFGVLDLADTDAFIAAFLAQDTSADLAPPAGVIDLDDVDAFIASFLGGCP